MQKVAASRLGWISYALVAGSVLWRWLERGHYYPGWDLIGPAHGLYLLSTRPLSAAFFEVLRSTRHFQYWNHANSLLFTLLPGELNRLWPWEFWGHLLTLSLTVATLAVSAAGLGLGSRNAWVLVLACGASPALLSFAIAGYPYAAGLLPYALALLIVSHPFLRRSWATALALGLVANETAWHVYEAGKGALLIFAAAALFERVAPWRTRLAWALVAAAQALQILLIPGANISAVPALLAAAGPGPVEALATGVGRLSGRVLDGSLDLPLLLPLGLALLGCVRRQRALLIAALLSQALPLIAVAAADDPSQLRPRRVLGLVFICILCIVAAWRDARDRPRLRAAILLLLIGGNGAQLVSTYRFFATPLRQRLAPLPYTESAADYRVPVAEVEAAGWLRSVIASNRRVVLLHNFATLSENTTDPAGLLERLYLALGHEGFVTSVVVFGSQACRYDCLPIRPVSELDRLEPAPALREGLVVYPTRQSEAVDLTEAMTILGRLRRSLELAPGAQAPDGYGSLRILGPRPPRRARVTVLDSGYDAGPHIRPRRRGFPVDMSWVVDARLNRWQFEPFDGPFRFRWGGRVEGTVARLSLLVGVRGAVRVTVGGRTAWQGRFDDLTFREVCLTGAGPSPRIGIELRGDEAGSRLLVDTLQATAACSHQPGSTSAPRHERKATDAPPPPA